MAKLIIFSGTPQARAFELKPGANRLGRGEANDFQISDASVSTHHAQIIVDGSSVRIQDLGSTNGTFINHAPVGEGVLQPGQPLRLGGVELLFLDDAAFTAPVAVPVAVPAVAPAPMRIKIPSPAPAPAVGGLRISGSHPATPALPAEMSPAEAPAPAPVSAAAAPHAMELAEPPPGKTACKFHPKIGGQWLCRKCNELFCPLCVSTKPTSEGTINSCRKCGTLCVPVKTKLVVSQEKVLVRYSDKTLLLRSVGFGFAAALVGALVWTGLSKLFGFDVPFLFAPMIGALCGYAVKIASQDTPGPLFSSIAVVFCVIGSVLGKLGMIWATHLTLMTNTVYLTAGLGVLIAMAAAWKIGGAD